MTPSIAIPRIEIALPTGCRYVGDEKRHIARGKAEFTLSDRRCSELSRAHHQFSNSQAEPLLHGPGTTRIGRLVLLLIIENLMLNKKRHAKSERSRLYRNKSW